MATSRPLVSVFSVSGDKTDQTVSLPPVLSSPLRPDVVQFVHTNMAKNARQAYAVNIYAGKQAVASSWGTGRAVARIPRVGGSGTSRSGQGAFGNMCRGGRMYNPTKTWRKWHKKINLTQKRLAVASALAATAVPALVMARGHLIDDVAEIPLVVENDIQTISKTMQAKNVLEALGASADVDRVAASKTTRAGKGKMRNRRTTQRRGPLLIYADGANEMEKAFRNLPGVELCCVERLNLLQLAPGGHLGRFCIWSQAALERLESLYDGTTKSVPRAAMTNADIARIINSTEIQSVVNPAKLAKPRPKAKANPLRNIEALEVLDPYAAEARLNAAQTQADQAKNRKERLQAKRKTRKEFRAQGKAFYASASKQGDVCQDGFTLE